MKPFNLEEALSGKKVVTRDGREVTEIHFFKTAKEKHQVVAIINEIAHGFYKNGENFSSLSDLDLFMAPEKVTKWVNVYLNREIEIGAIPFDSEVEAKELADRDLIATVPITFEV